MDNDQEENTTGFSLMPISDKEFNTITGMVYRQAGISLSPKKKTLVVGRLQMMLRTLGLNSFTEYIDFLANDPSGGALQDMIDRISTNHTFFFREEAHFEFFHKTALPEMEILANKKGEKDLRIWSAGCATGEEPYMLAMLLTEYFGQNLSGWDAGVLATDISTKALKTAVEGMYPDDKLAHIPIHLRRKYFYDEGNGMWRVVDQLKREVTFRQFNLMTPEFPFKRRFQIIFCRNVMIYFDQETRDVLVNKFQDHLVEGGYLFVGHSETLRHFKTDFEYIMPALYRKRVHKEG